MKTTYCLNNRSYQDVAYIVKNYLEISENMDTQIFAADNGTMVVQARSRGGKYKQWVGLDKAITVTVTNVNDAFANVEIGSGKWVDKGIAMTVSMFVLWPLTVTSGIGMYKQAKLPAKINDAISKGLMYSAPVANPAF